MNLHYLGMSSEHIEVRRLVDSIMKLMKPLLNRPQALPVPTPAAAAISSSLSPSTPEVAVVRQWQQGKGVVVLEDSAASNGPTEKKVEKVEKKKEDRLHNMLKDAPKPEKIGMALFGMQVRFLFSNCIIIFASHLLIVAMFGDNKHYFFSSFFFGGSFHPMIIAFTSLLYSLLLFKSILFSILLHTLSFIWLHFPPYSKTLLISLK